MMPREDDVSIKTPVRPWIRGRLGGRGLGVALVLLGVWYGDILARNVERQVLHACSDFVCYRCILIHKAVRLRN